MKVASAHIRLLLVILSVWTVVSCLKEQQQVEEQVNHSGKVRLCLDAFAEQGTKATLVSFPSFHWEYPDQITVWGISPSVFSVQPGSISESSASFEGEISYSGESLLAVYPASASIGRKGNRIVVDMPSRQYIPVGNNVDPRAMICLAQQNGAALPFKNLFSIIRVTLLNDHVTGIVIEGKQGEALAGKVEVLHSPTPEVVSVIEGHRLIDVRPQGFGYFAPGTYYIPVLPSILATGVNVGIRTSLCAEQVIGTSATVTLPRNGGVDFGAVDVAAASKPSTVVIRQVEDFNELYLKNSFSADAILGNDIDMEGVSQTGYVFSGSLDGQGHSVCNFAIADDANASFFASVRGDAEMSHIAFGTRDGKRYDGVSSITLSASGSSAVAGIIGSVDAGATAHLSGLVNYTPLSASSRAGAEIAVGAFCGEWGGNGAASDLSNHGTIILTEESGSNASKSSVGGITGHSKGGASYRCCSNDGPLSITGGSNSQAVNFVGGIVGQMSGASGAIEWCSNAGNIENAMTQSQKYYTGGIVGTVEKVDLIRRCVNNAEIFQKGNVGYAYFAGVAGSIDGSDPEVSGCTNNGGVHNSGLISGSSANLRMAGIVANPKGGTTGVSISHCTNNGVVSNLSSTLQPCLGGIVGSNTANPVSLLSCVNSKSAAISSISQTSTTIAQCNVGGIIGLSSANGMICRDCENQATVSVQNVGTTTLAEAGGLIGRSGYVQVSGCSANGTVATSTATTAECGMVAGRVGSSATVKSTGIGGVLCGNEMTESNWKNSITGVNGNITTDGGPESCYLMETSDDADIEIKVGSFNLWRPLSRISDRSTYPEISEYRLWQYAVPAIAESIASMDCDIIGFVELYSAPGAAAYTDTSAEMAALTDAATDNKYIWQLHFPNKANNVYTYCNGFAYNASRLEVVEAPVRIWLNKNTGEFSTTLLDGYRTLVYVKMREKASGKEFWFAVTHLDLDTVEHNVNTAKAVVGWARKYVAHSIPCILVGDMNCSSGIRAAGYSTLKQYWIDSYESVRDQGLMDMQYLTYPATRPGDSKLGLGTASEWEQMKEERWRWDHIFVDGLSVTSYTGVFDSYAAADGNNYWLSDHFPITATFKLATGSSLSAPMLSYDIDTNPW